ncbi:DUF4270 family protein [Carboxylicivirga mesophila]|uniref:DUF4270 family protein n=1 Tax=Carboxylicivirga mesophila TaxID=1166478 RepID=A0ABS5KA15_9BACT|nr:DUF4270 family protein [Carboxylicivirga mesophila]MBS2211722.1 DUF4270 family protein [Carboxylicivirga mesophila]
MQHQTIYKHTVFIIVLIVGLASCQQGELDLRDDFIGSDSYTALIDTVTIQMSTFRSDSVVSSSTGSALIGHIHHKLLGGQEAKSYFTMSYPNDLSWDTEKQVFDSLLVVLKPNGYYIGDTIADAEYHVHRVNETISSDDGYYYSTNSFSYDEVPIASKSFHPSPGKGNELTIRLNDNFAKEIIDFVNEYKNHSDKSTLFKEQFKGLVFTCDTNTTRSAIGYSSGDESAIFRFYSHTIGIEKEEIVDELSIDGTLTQFNHFYSNDKSIKYNQLDNRKTLLREQDADNMTLLQNGSGLQFRIDFPTINNLLELKAQGHIVKAELRIKPNMEVMAIKDLPSTLYIADIYRANEIWGYLSDSNGNTLNSSLVIDYIYQEDTYYTFDITYYLNSRLLEPVVDIDRGLVISLPDNVGSSYSWLAANGKTSGNNPSELLLYYYYYDTE